MRTNAMKRTCAVCGRPVNYSSKTLVANGMFFHEGCYFRRKKIKCTNCGYEDMLPKGSLIANPRWKCPRCGFILKVEVESK